MIFLLINKTTAVIKRLAADLRYHAPQFYNGGAAGMPVSYNLSALLVSAGKYLERSDVTSAFQQMIGSHKFYVQTTSDVGPT